MRRLADRVVTALLRIVPWYDERRILARERRTQRVHRQAIQSRKEAERVLGRPLASYHRVRIGR